MTTKNTPSNVQRIAYCRTSEYEHRPQDLLPVHSVLKSRSRKCDLCKMSETCNFENNLKPNEIISAKLVT